ncbi:hypothetical protein PCANC_01808 [Puccinia coronata f. sp. avenae]|uniref:EGF-like domain-containing protein n=1 Tax=Puccinia coronata f. sp. avenae TaxID=200324 RepID=A0A2N5W561_9BASI|nr:hypothetical protein PCANC_01808 [Puccinia coronata f. sp. avenae]
MILGGDLEKTLQVATFLFFGVALSAPKVLGSTINSLCTPGICINGSTSQVFAGAVLDDPPISTLLTPGNYSRFHDASRGRANPGFVIDQQAGLVVTQLSPMIAYSRPLYQDQPQLIEEDFDKPNIRVTSFLLAKGYQAAFGINGTVKAVVHDSCPNVKQWKLQGLELISIESSNCPQGGCGSGGSCSWSTSTCQCKTGYTGSRCDSCANGYFGPNCQRCPNCDSSPDTTCDDGTTGTGSCLALGLNKTQNLLSISQSRCNCLNGVCTGSTSCACSAGWTTASNGTLCASCMDGFFLDPRGDGPSGSCQSCVQGFQLSKNDSTSCLPSTINLAGGTPTSCNDGFFNSHNTTCTPCDPACKSCFGASASSCTQCVPPKALLSTGHTNNHTLDATCVDVDPNTGVCSSPPGSLFLLNQSKGICEPAPHLCSAATIPGFSLLHPESTSSSGAVCSACVPGALLLPDRPDGVNGKCAGICPNGTYDDLHGHCSSCPTGCSTCNITGDGTHPQCTTCANASAFLFAGTCVDACPAGTFASVTANETPHAPKGVNACLTCSASCGSCQSPTACQSCPNNLPAFDPVTQTCSLACPKGRFADPNLGGRCSLCEASCETCSGVGSSDCLSCKDGDTLHEGKCLPSTCASNSTHNVAGWGVCLEDLLAANTENNTKSPSAWLIALVVMLLLATFVALFLLTWRLWQRKKRQHKTKQFGSELATSDIKLHHLDERKLKGSARPDWRVDEDYRLDWSQDMIPTVLYSSRPTPPASEFKIKRKVVPTESRTDDSERESMSIYSQSEHLGHTDASASTPQPPVTKEISRQPETQSTRNIGEQSRTLQDNVWI